LKQLGKRLTYANVMSSIAVFLVLGGGAAFAADQLGKNSVGSKQLKKSAVTTAKIKRNAVTTAKIRNRAVTGAKINLATLGTVPSATHAGVADSAGNANTVGGSSVGKVFAKVSVNGTATLGTFGAFKFDATCDGSGNVTIEVDPQSTDTDYAASGNGAPEGAFFAREGGVEPNSEAISGENDRGQVNFAGAQSGGAVVTGVLGWDDVASFDDEEACAVYGHMTVSG
jgi:hypothetical protein